MDDPTDMCDGMSHSLTQSIPVFLSFFANRISLTPIALLTQTGDKLNLVVVTPYGDVVYQGNQYDELSGGRHESDTTLQDVGFPGLRVHNIYFPMDGSSPNGSYEFFVDLINKAGARLDVWTLTFVSPGDGILETFTGAGASEIYSYNKIPDELKLLDDSFESCRVQPDIECCNDADCSQPGTAGLDEVCISFRCVADGSPRFTLSWIGGEHD